MNHSLHSADKPTHRKIVLVGLLCCAVFVVVSFLGKSQPEKHFTVLKAEKTVRTAGKPLPAN